MFAKAALRTAARAAAPARRLSTIESVVVSPHFKVPRVVPVVTVPKLPGSVTKNTEVRGFSPSRGRAGSLASPTAPDDVLPIFPLPACRPTTPSATPCTRRRRSTRSRSPICRPRRCVRGPAWGTGICGGSLPTFSTLPAASTHFLTVCCLRAACSSPTASRSRASLPCAPALTSSRATATT